MGLNVGEQVTNVKALTSHHQAAGRVRTGTLMHARCFESLKRVCGAHIDLREVLVMARPARLRDAEPQRGEGCAPCSRSLVTAAR